MLFLGKALPTNYFKAAGIVPEAGAASAIQHPGSIPNTRLRSAAVFLDSQYEKSPCCFGLNKSPNVQAKFICVSFYRSTTTIERSQ